MVFKVIIAQKNNKNNKKKNHKKIVDFTNDEHKIRQKIKSGDRILTL